MDSQAAVEPPGTVFWDVRRERRRCRRSADGACHALAEESTPWVIRWFPHTIARAMEFDGEAVGEARLTAVESDACARGCGRERQSVAVALAEFKQQSSKEQRMARDGKVLIKQHNATRRPKPHLP